MRVDVSTRLHVQQLMGLIDVRQFHITIEWKTPAALAPRNGGENALHPNMLFFHVRRFFEEAHVSIDLRGRRCAA